MVVLFQSHLKPGGTQYMIQFMCHSGIRCVLPGFHILMCSAALFRGYIFFPPFPCFLLEMVLLNFSFAMSVIEKANPKGGKSQMRQCRVISARYFQSLCFQKLRSCKL